MHVLKIISFPEVYLHEVDRWNESNQLLNIYQSTWYEVVVYFDFSY